MPDSRRSPNSRQTRAREEFVDAAIRVIDADGPNPSMNAIAREAGSTKPRLYRQFSDKSDLLSALGERMADEVYQLAVADFNFLLDAPSSALRHALRGYSNVVDRHPNVFRALAQSRSWTEDSSSGTFDIGRDVARRFAGVATSVLTSIGLDNQGVEFTSRAAVGAIVATTDLWLEEESETMDIDRFVDQLTDLIGGLLRAFLERTGVEIDPEEPVFVILAKLKQ
ncbi:TetR/AcrR family transcriptional regulator [Rhodococcus sp. 14-2483-1-2]|uniref:TetR/AcrR family transcriptional regulator n=1 Tax=Rhodococcus sp. 14-2483-1-2 TaxID=2023147 RepID=UPI000B9C5871|nr:TetR/AcrR family transcriptional regulator [Rhodococcus sp. 14-2483-1-2]OZF37195.1 TetR family transcriptional regulator [Rhodococcus sp. 14-2483-1-2]